MSRRRSRLPHAVNPDCGFQVNEFLKGVIITDLQVLFALADPSPPPQLAARTPRTPKDTRIFVSENDNHASKLQSHLTDPVTLIFWDGVTKEADSIPETLTVVERGEAKQQEPIRKPSAEKKKSTKRAISRDVEWDTLIGDGKTSAPPKKRRRKHYVVHNSLPLSRDLQNDRFQFVLPEPCDPRTGPITTQICGSSQKTSSTSVKSHAARVSSAKPLLPLSVIRSMLVPTRPKGKGSPMKSPNHTTGGVCVSRVIPRSRPGSGFDHVNGNRQPLFSVDPMGNESSSMYAGKTVSKSLACSTIPLEYEALPLPSVPKAVCALLSIGTPAEPEIEITAERSKSNPIGLKYPANKRKANDSVVTPEQPLTGIMVKLILTVSSPRFKGRGLRGLTWITTETRESVEENWGSRTIEPSKILGVIDELADEKADKSSREKSRKPSIQQECSPHEAKPLPKDHFEQIEGLADEIAAANQNNNSESTPKSIQKGLEGVSEQNPKGDLAACGIRDIEIDECLFTPFGLRRRQAKLEMRALSPPLFTRRSSKGLLRQAVSEPEMRAPSPVKGSPERSQVSAAGSIPGGKKPPTPHNKQTRIVLTDSDESEAEPTLLVSRRLFTNRPSESSYFSIAQRVLKDNSDNSVKLSPAGYLRRSDLATQHFPILNEVIDEEEQDVSKDGEDMVVSSTMLTGTYDLSTKFSTPSRSRTLMTPVALKDLLNRTGSSSKRRPSVSAEPSNQEQKGVALQATGVGLVPTPNLPSTSTASRPKSAYGLQADPRVIHPYVSPLRKSSPEVTGSRKPRKRTRRTTMTSRLETPVQKRFKLPLLNDIAEALMDSSLGETGTIARRSRTTLLKRRTELNLGSPNIDIRRIASFAAVWEAW